MLVVLMLVLMAVAMLVVLVLVLMAVAMLVMLMLVLMAVAMLVVLMLVLMAVAMLVVLMLMLMAVAMLVVLMLVLMAVAMLVVPVMVVMVSLLLKLCKLTLESVLALNCRKNVLAVKTVPGGGYDDRIGVMLTDKGYCRLDLRIRRGVGVREDDCGCVSYLVVIELAEVLHVHLTLADVGNGGECVEDGIVPIGCHSSLDNVGELAYSRRLDDNAIGRKSLYNLAERLCKIADQRAADAAGVHLGDLDTRILKKAAVNTDLTKLVLDKHDLLVSVSLLDKLLYKRGLSGSEKSGKNIYFRHFYLSPEGRISYLFLK